LQAIATARRLAQSLPRTTCGPPQRNKYKVWVDAFVELPIEAKDAQDARGYATAQGEEFYKKQRELLGGAVAASDVVITAAVIPGKNHRFS